VDVFDFSSDFSPFILMMGDSATKSGRVWIRMSREEYDLLTSKEILACIQSAFLTHSAIQPVIVGELVG
jgi:hypothetical protein